MALFLVVAWRVAHLMRLGRTCPDLHAHLFFDPDEIRAAYLLTKTRPPAQPKLNDLLRLVARLGGFLARKGDGEPGAETIWKGLTKVHVAAETMRLLREDGGNDACV
ncbi:IS4 family transposase ISAzo5 [Pararobbsia alpina]|uniref:IS4 family transposase ISAzo5 n=1 Tax=Pararobbsia alpina TaxID=621374 RepID=A0A6S7AVU2_9BURK|nr:IS4 family transposase ISAzo5 [Pararobbsia alpina]